jgi:type 1 fimbriae regulatory protein FimB/type 1 fimbriae regulatory protein FimE
MSNYAALVTGPEPAVTTELDTGRDSRDRATPRQWLTEREVEAIIRHASGPRDKLMILLAYRHGLRVSELVSLTWAQIDLEAGRLVVRRLKHCEDSAHPLAGRELRGLRILRRQHSIALRLPHRSRDAHDPQWLLQAARGGGSQSGSRGRTSPSAAPCHRPSWSTRGFDTLSQAAYLGHRQVANTKRYCRMDNRRFEGLWRD